MAGIVYVDRVQETTTTEGTNPYALGGPVSGYQSFDAIGAGNVCYYCAYESDAYGVAIGDWEVGRGTLGTRTLSRDQILASSKGGTTAVNWLPGTRRIFLVQPASAIGVTTTIPTHASTHRPAASDPIPNVAWTDYPNTFGQSQTMAALLVSGAWTAAVDVANTALTPGNQRFRVTINGANNLALQPFSDDGATYGGNQIEFSRSGNVYANAHWAADAGGFAMANWPRTAVAANAAVGDGAVIFFSTSSLRYKSVDHEVSRAEGRRLLMAIPAPIVYRSTVDDDQRTWIGFGAETIAETEARMFATFAKDGRPESVTYDRMVAALVPVAQDHDDRLADLESRLAALEAAIKAR